MSHPVRPPLSPELEQGQRQAQLALGVLFVLGVVPTLSSWVRGDFQNAPARIFGFALSGYLLWQVYRGSRPALYLTLALALPGGLALLLLSPLGGVSVTTLILMLAGLGFAVCGLALTVHPPVRDFLAAQRGSRSGRPGSRP